MLLQVLNVIGRDIVHVEKTGNAQLTKLSNQLLFNICCPGIAEVLNMAARLGQDPQKSNPIGRKRRRYGGTTQPIFKA